MRRRLPAPLLVLASVTSVQAGAALATRLFPAAGPGGTVFLRLTASAVLMLALAGPGLRRAAVGRRDLGWAVVFGVVVGAMNAAFYGAIARVPLGLAVTVEFVGPLGVAVATGRSRRDLGWAALAAGGVVTLTSGGGRASLPGVGLALCAGALWAAYILVNQQVGRRFSGAGGLVIALAVGALLTAPLGILTAGRRLLHPGTIARGAAVGVLSSAIPYSLEVAALRRLRASVFGVLMSIEPAVAALSGLLFLGQRLSLRDWLAILAVSAASAGVTLTGRGGGDRARAEPVLVEPGVTPAGAAAGSRAAG